MAQLISIKDTRNRLTEIVDQVSFKEEVFIITKFGKPKAMIIPLSDTKMESSGIEESFGAWAKRDDIKDSNVWVSNLRKKMNARS